MSGQALTPADFPTFFKAVWGVDPFPWQADLLTRLATGEDGRRGRAGEAGVWPAVLDLPTGSGKTAALDIALFHLALEAGQGERRRAPVRIAFVVDRRLIVDDAYARARTLECKLKQAIDQPATADAVVLKVARALCRLAGDGQPPLVARRLRGGAPREDDWARTPVQPTILCSTVDQVGSRLLFRGYGVSDSMKPVHAGLLGSDCLILLDEAHLAEPFRQTLDWVQRLRGGDAQRAPFAFAVLTATPGQDESDRFELSEADRAHRTLKQRIGAAKPVRLVEKPTAKSDTARADAFAVEATAAIGRLQAAGIANPALGVVVNRVARARAVFERLKEELKDEVDLLLLIGPARAVDLDDITRALAPIRTRDPAAPRQLFKPLLVVATQTIEAGVDIDFDGLITEAAAFDALRQRFGRLNRAGRDIETEAAILAFKDDLGSKADDPVYGDRIKATWAALSELAGNAKVIDFGIEAMRGRLDANAAAELAAPVNDAPVLMPAYAHLWSQTAPIPNADPEVALFLHGPNRSPASVQIVWRADIERDDLLAAGSDNRRRDRLLRLLKLVPPRATEAVEVPLWAAAAFLKDQADRLPGLSDVSEREPSLEADNHGLGKPAFRWTGDEQSSRAVFAADLRAGDLLVVPASYGGCDRWGWSPASRAPVRDVAQSAAEPYRSRRFAVRVTPELIAQQADEADAPSDRGAIAARLADLLARHESDGPDDVLAAVLALPGLPDGMKRALEKLQRPSRGGAEQEERRKGRLEVEMDVYGRDGGDRPKGVVLIAPRGINARSKVGDPAAAPSTESEEQSAVADEPLTLADHCGHVEAWAAAFSAAAGLPPAIAADMALAARLHDAGKAYWRYRAYFAGGDPYGSPQDEPLAKAGQRRLPAHAWDRAGLTPRWRHEALSVRAAVAHPALKGANDPLLVLWLIGTHHGHGRPLFPHADPPDVASRPLHLPSALGGMMPLNDTQPGPQSLAFDFGGLDWVQVFDTLKARYGIWGLARLEAFVRLADHRASEVAAAPQAKQDRKEAAE